MRRRLPPPRLVGLRRCPAELDPELAVLALAGRRPAALAHEALSVAFVVAITVDSSRESSTGDAVLALRDASRAFAPL